MHWLLAHQAHLVSSLILELQDIWFQPRRHSPHLTCKKVHQLYWEMTLSLKILAKGGLIFTMVSSAMCCMFQVFPLTSYQCIRWLTQGLQRRSYSPLMKLTEISSGKVIAKGVANHTSKVYMFSHFLPVIADFTTLGESQIVWTSPVPLKTH